MRFANACVNNKFDRIKKCAMPSGTTIASKKKEVLTSEAAHAHLRRFNIINNYMDICTFDASKPLEAARKAHN